MTWIENIEEAIFARKKRMFEFNSLPCTCGNHICRLLITFAKSFVSPDLVPNCLQKLSADNFSRQGVKRNFEYHWVLCSLFKKEVTALWSLSKTHLT